jgi:chaperone LolA
MKIWCWLLLLLVPAIQAEPSLQERLGAIKSLEGEFSQRILAENGEELERSSGRFRLLHPGFFSWHIQTPDEQLLLATGDSLLHYDVELETATRRQVGEGQSRGPLEILGGDGQDLHEHYQVEQTGHDSYRLQPVVAGGDFSSLHLTFDGELPVRMTVEDQLRQTTIIEFSEVRLNPPLGAADFEFSPPEGVDLYYHEP